MGRNDRMIAFLDDNQWAMDSYFWSDDGLPQDWEDMTEEQAEKWKKENQ